MSESAREIYIEALEKIDYKFCFYSEPTEFLRVLLLNYSEGVRQTREARIARIALKEASYARINESIRS